MSPRADDAGNGYSTKLKLTASGSVMGYLIGQINGVRTSLTARVMPGIPSVAVPSPDGLFDGVED
jgi:hypothetical protein